MFGPDRKVKSGYLKQLYKKGWYFTEREIEPPKRASAEHSYSEAIKRQEQVEEFHQMLPGKECGACGTPDCRTFAEDVVDGKAAIESCIFLEGYRKNGENK
jgi:ArsR family metal-binding transcriptional regulator